MQLAQLQQNQMFPSHPRVVVQALNVEHPSRAAQAVGSKQLRAVNLPRLQSRATELGQSSEVVGPSLCLWRLLGAG